MTIGLKVAHCPGCGKVYQINMRNLCLSCSTAEDELMQAIEKQLKRNRHLNTAQLAELTSTREEKLRSWIRKGKLKLYDYPNLADACDLCAEPIRSGKLCVKCAMRIQGEVRQEYEKERLQQERRKTANSYYTKA